jgi:outer membrane protein
MKQAFLLLLLFLSFTKLKAQEPGTPWTLQQCIEYALKNNIQIKQNELNADLARANSDQSRAAALPNLNGNVSHSYNFGRTIDPFTNQFATDRVLSQNFSISSSVTLFNGFQTVNTIKENHYNYMASKFNVDKMRNDISLNIATAYLQILFNTELRDIAQSQLSISVSQVERTKKLVEAGSLAKGSLLDIQAQNANDELMLANAQNQLDLAYLNLAQMLDLKTPQGFSIVKPDINISSETPKLVDPGQVFLTAVANQPEIKSAEYSERSAKKSLDVAKGGISPRLTLSGSFGTGYSGASKRVVTVTPTGADTVGFTTGGDYVLSPSFSSTFETTPFNDQIQDNLNKSIGLYLTIPIFNGLQVKTAISRAKINRQNAEYNLQLAKNQLEKNIQQAYYDANAALIKYNSSQKALAAMTESFKYTEQRFNVGLLNSLDYNTAKNNLVKTESELLQAKYDYVFKTKVLDFYQGKPLTL